MTVEQRDAVDRALIAFSQISCLCMALREMASEDGPLCDAIGGVGALAQLEGDKLDHGAGSR